VFVHRCDLLDPAQQEGLIRQIAPSHLLHLAWYTRHGEYWHAPENLTWTAASLQLTLLFSRQGGARAVFAGTCAEYDWDHPLAVEDVTPLRPRTLYGTAKHALHQVVESFARTVSLSQAWGRLFFPFGPHEAPERLVPSVVRALLLGEPARCSEGSQVRDFVYVSDAAAALVALLDSAVTGAVNVGGFALPVRDLVQEIGRQAGRPHLIRFGALPARAGDPPELRADLHRLGSEVKFAPRFSMEAGVRETIDWWRLRLGGAPSRGIDPTGA
jgi:nucleoside-diphosphate-sugar epimerase